MTYNPDLVDIISKLKSFAELPKTVSDYRVGADDFTRHRKLSFSDYAYLGISSLKNSLSVELHNLLGLNSLPVVSKSAYSQARYKIEADFYQAWNTLLISLLYGRADSGVKKWKGYFLDAIDGSKMTLPQTTALKEAFGVQVGGSATCPTETVQGSLLCRVDVLNQYIQDVAVFALAIGELSKCKEWLWKLRSSAITLFDRGFSSAAHFAFMVKMGKPFVCRLKVGFNKQVKDFVASQEVDSVLHFVVGKTEKIPLKDLTPEQIADTSQHDAYYATVQRGETVAVRVVKILLPTGEIEVLATSLYDTQQFTREDLKELYHFRWGIETIYDSLKNQMLLMCFSGIKAEAIYQDVYATVFVHNLRQMLVGQAQILVDQKQKEKEENSKKKESEETKKKPRKEPHKQKINQNVATGVLKNTVMSLFLTKEPDQIIHDLIQYFAKNTTPIILHKKTPQRKPSLAKRRNLVVQPNYRRAM